MQTYSSRTFTIKKDTQELYELVQKPSNLQPIIDKAGDKLPIKHLELTDSSMAVDAPVVGSIRFERSESTPPSLIRYTGSGTPVPMSIAIHLRPGETSGETIAQLSVDADIPAFLSGMFGGKIKDGLAKAADALEQFEL